MRAGIVIVALLVVFTAAWAKDIVSMPEVDMMGPGQVEAAYIYWRNPGGFGLSHANVGELFVGLNKWAEIDVDHVRLSDKGPMGQNVTEVNAYFKVCSEVPGARPAVTVGATNILRSTWLPSSERVVPNGDDRISPFAVVAYTLHAPEGPPSWRDIAVRLQVGYGTNYHEDQLFGILQAAFTPNIFAGIQHYQGVPGYLVGWNSGKGWAVAVGTLGGDHGWIHANYDFKF
jgi:hypothetical protein